MHPFSRSTTRSTTAIAAATLLVAGGLAEAGTAQARTPARTVVTGGLVTPLTVGVLSNGTAYISENAAGLLVRKVPGQKPKVVYHARKKGVEVGGVSANPGFVTFTLTPRGLERGAHKRSLVMHLTHGRATRFANTGAFERNQNPDQNVVYGFRHLNKRCLSKVPGPVPARYTGIVDSHPYSTAVTGMTTYVGDAAGNDILRVDSSGHISLVTVMPAVGLKVTPKRAKANKLPACTVGHRYYFEPVPTDVEVAPDGTLVVSELVGASDAPGFGGQSRVYTVNPGDGSTELVAKGLHGAVGVAIAANGSYLVSQLDGKQVSRVDATTGAVSRFRSVDQPAAVERVGGKVYVTSRVLAKKPSGRLLRFPG